MLCELVNSCSLITTDFCLLQIDVAVLLHFCLAVQTSLFGDIEAVQVILALHSGLHLPRMFAAVSLQIDTSTCMLRTCGSESHKFKSCVRASDKIRDLACMISGDAPLACAFLDVLAQAAHSPKVPYMSPCMSSWYQALCRLSNSGALSNVFQGF